jgi:hypothetical protein
MWRGGGEERRVLERILILRGRRRVEIFYSVERWVDKDV